MIARILAVVAAVGLVAGAIVLRGAIADGDAGPGDNASPGLIWCDPLVADACTAAADGAEVEQIEPGDALARLSDPEAEGPPPSMWVTAGDWSAILAMANPNAEIPAFGSPTLVASTPLDVAAKGDNLELLNVSCGTTMTWTCLAQAAGQNATALGGKASMGEFRLGHVVPPSSTGLATLAGLAPTIVEGDEAPNRSDVESQAYRALLSRISSGELGVSTRNATNKFLTRPGEASVFVGPRALLAPNAAARGFKLQPLEPVLTLTAQVAPLATSPIDDAAAPAAGSVAGFVDRLGAELTGAGWDPPVDDGADPGLLAALLDRWNS